MTSPFRSLSPVESQWWSTEETLDQEDPWDTDTWFRKLLREDLWTGLQSVHERLSESGSEVNYATHKAALYCVIRFLVWRQIASVKSTEANKAKITGLFAKANTLMFRVPDDSKANQELAMAQWNLRFEVRRANTGRAANAGENVTRAAKFSVKQEMLCFEIFAAEVNFKHLFFEGLDLQVDITALDALTTKFRVRFADGALSLQDRAEKLANIQDIGWMTVVLAARFRLLPQFLQGGISFNLSPEDPVRFVVAASPISAITCERDYGSETIKFTAAYNVHNRAMTFLAWPSGVRLNVEVDISAGTLEYTLVLGSVADTSYLQRIADALGWMSDLLGRSAQPWSSNPIASMTLVAGRTWSKLPVFTLNLGRKNARLVTADEDVLTQLFERARRNAVRVEWEERLVRDRTEMEVMRAEAEAEAERIRAQEEGAERLRARLPASRSRKRQQSDQPQRRTSRLRT